MIVRGDGTSLGGYTSTDKLLAAIEEHAQILDALSAGDVEAAALAVNNHIQAVKTRVIGDFYSGSGE